ncbi:DUF4411 family protein [Caldibacillus debilis]|uniref:DUF4411 family protein n=1 Tax=Caldibacillus debilis TaxID=301148 RepID=UPI0003622333|nr:DUF4411 family protein [Caldibacillus debilis]MBO2482391.1 DUF4411 domain-containing protein [Bacillaceae bacterium]OUM91463.1 MAG: twitching motility protein PilT [Caldibacillus debilis]REJ25924.1 MAG: DUF4411 domain-containing protein [Caldibacillus debilis]
MSGGRVYLLDANIFIDAYKKYYAFDIVPSFWEKIKQQAEAGRIISIDRVKDEIDRYHEEDELKIWVNQVFGRWFVSTDNEEVIESYREIINWAYHQSQFTDAAKNEFASVADSWLIACAKTYNCALVSWERHRPEKKSRIPMPNVCLAFHIPYIGNTFDWLRELRVKI